MKINKNDIILIIIVLCVAVSGLFLYMNFGKEEPAKVMIFVDGVERGSYSLSEDTKVEVNGTNTLAIENGKVRMEEADCPDQICVHHKAISKNKESIVCLPNKVVVEIVSSETTELDSIVK